MSLQISLVVMAIHLTVLSALAQERVATGSAVGTVVIEVLKVQKVDGHTCYTFTLRNIGNKSIIYFMVRDRLSGGGMGPGGMPRSFLTKDSVMLPQQTETVDAACDPTELVVAGVIYADGTTDGEPAYTGFLSGMYVMFMRAANQFDSKLKAAQAANKSDEAIVAELNDEISRIKKRRIWVGEDELVDFIDRLINQGKDSERGERLKRLANLLTTIKTRADAKMGILTSRFMALTRANARILILCL